MLKIYNTLTKQKEEFRPLQEGKVSMYTCGVTVYDDCHIGHARSIYVFEVMRRYFEYKGFKVDFVRNITDIDDKILIKSLDVAKNKSISLDDAWQEVVETNISNYRKDVEDLDLRVPDFEPKASEYVEKIIDFISVLIQRGYAYESDGSVYFRTRKYNEEYQCYGELSGKKIDDLYSGVRKGQDEAKEEALDFVLWKAKKENEVGWESPWGDGRPGWHIECSVMSTDILGDTFDIHGGGLDLVFPHHENEIAQSKAKSGKDYAKLWIHHGLLSINRQKMSKSLGNFVTIQDILSKYSSDILKIFFSQAGYSSTIDFSWERIEEAKKAYARILNLKERLDEIQDIDPADLSKDVLTFKEQFEECMDDDFNTPKALAVLFDLAHFANRAFDAESLDVLPSVKSLFYKISEVVALSFKKIEKTKNISEIEVLEKIKLRTEAKQNKDYAAADAIRDELLALGVAIKDKSGGITDWEYV